MRHFLDKHHFKCRNIRTVFSIKQQKERLKEERKMRTRINVYNSSLLLIIRMQVRRNKREKFT